MHIETSTRSDKKYVAIFNDGTKTHFGQRGASDYTQHKDEKRRELYQRRHQADLETRDPKRAGFLAYYLLWNKPTLAESLRDYKRRFGDL